MIFARSNGLHENAETAILGRRRGPARKKKELIPVAGRRRKYMHRCARVTKYRE